MEKEIKKEKVIVNVEKERAEFKKLIIENPNYFGTFPEVKIKPVKPMKVNTKYEELKCIGFYPESDLLEAIIDVKLSYGYGGNLCSQGSFEYVRFFVDWNGDGDFTDASEDVGIASVNVHDIPDGEKVCLDKTKPISYALTVKIDSKKRVCKNPYMVKVRAILSWDFPPPPGNPNYPPVWGNVVDKWIQIKPAKLFLKDIIKVADLKELKLEPAMLDLDMPVSKKKELSVAELKEIYKDKDVPELRFNIAEVKELAENIKLNPHLMVQYKINPKLKNIADMLEVVLAEKPNTKYEELRCVGLHYDMDMLVATLTVKLPCGYSGDLCTKGSYQYVGFWAYIWDQIEQMCYWKYLGTSSVNVYDITNIPPEGLQYAVYLPVDLSSFKDKCTKHKVLKIRGILSWQNPPPNNNPNHNPVWGNKVDALIQIKPGKFVESGKQIPFITFVGGMVVNKISGNSETIIPSAIGDGYANGVNALESPFGSVISICGRISNPPDITAGAAKLKYKVQYKKSTETNWHDIDNNFKIYISTWNGTTWSQSPESQIATSGYYEYKEDLSAPPGDIIQQFIDGSDYGGGSVLADWHTPVAGGDGLYEIRVLLYKLGAPPSPGVPADNISSNVIKIMVDNTSPNAEISLDAGPCEFTKPPAIITGTFKATDNHFWQYSISLSPYGPSTNDKFKHRPLPALEYTYGQVPAYPTLPASGAANGTFKLDTKDMKPCGYVIYLHIWDRTIVNNYMQGNQNGASVGFCLLK